MGSNRVHGEVYSIQHYMIKFASDLLQVSGVLWFPPPIKLTANIVESGINLNGPPSPSVAECLMLTLDHIPTDNTTDISLHPNTHLELGF